MKIPHFNWRTLGEGFGEGGGGGGDFGGGGDEEDVEEEADDVDSVELLDEWSELIEFEASSRDMSRRGNYGSDKEANEKETWMYTYVPGTSAVYRVYIEFEVIHTSLDADAHRK